MALYWRTLWGKLNLRDVHLSYPARPGQQIFSGFSITIPTGTTMALVGESGSGKSTVVGLVQRGLYTMVAILKDPRILLLDEATSALDAEYEHVVQEALNNVMVNRTTKIVMHRLSTVNNADKYQCYIVDSSRKKLIKDNSGAYSQLIRLQELQMNSHTLISIEDQTKQSDDVKSGNKVFRRLANLHKPETPILLLGCFASSANGAIFPNFGLLIPSAIKTFYEPAHQLRWKLIEHIRALSFTRVVYQEIGWFDDPLNSSGASGSRLSADGASIRGIAGDVLPLIVQNISTAIVGIIIAMIANWKLACIVLCFVPCVFAQSYAQARFMRGFSANAKEMYEQASTIASDAIGNIRTAASYCVEEKIVENYRKKCEGPVKEGVRQGAILGVGYGFSFALLFCFYAISFYVGARVIHEGTADVGQVIKLTSMARDFSKVEDAAVSIFGIIDRKSAIDASSEEGEALETVEGNIELQHVSFKYPARKDVQIFRDLCLKIPSGKTVTRRKRAQEIDGDRVDREVLQPGLGRHLRVNLRSRRLSCPRQQVGLIGQEPVLFNDTIRVNIMYGKTEPVTEEVVAVAEAANVHRFISALPRGYDTGVGELGVQLSSGQKQRIAVARAILWDPQVLLLDEATSALDAESERAVQEALDRVMVGRTTVVVVAHRLSTITGVTRSRRQERGRRGGRPARAAAASSPRWGVCVARRIAVIDSSSFR
ncbi:hypothetical protein ACP4OV_023874 [Aristida adscensionis]